MNQHEQIQRAWALTEEIEAAADASDWARAAALTVERSPLLMSLTSDQPAESLATIRKIQTSIEWMTKRTQTEQTILNATYLKSMGRAQAAKQYQKAKWL
jgi:flagellar protein FliT